MKDNYNTVKRQATSEKNEFNYGMTTSKCYLVN